MILTNYKKIFYDSRKKEKKSINKLIKNVNELPLHKLPLYELNKHPSDLRIIHIDCKYIIDNEINNDYFLIKDFVDGFFSIFSVEKTLKRLMNNNKYSKHHRYYNKSKEYILKKWSNSEDKKNDLDNKLHRSIRLYQDVNNIIPAYIAPLEYYFFRRFQKYANQRKWVAYRNDWDIFHEELKLVGRVDMIYRHKNKKEFVLVEWKRKNTIIKKGIHQAKFPVNKLIDSEWNRFVLTMNLYKYILENKYDCKIREMMLVNMYAGYPSHTDFHIHKIPSFKSDVLRLCKYRLSLLLNKA